MHAPRTTTATPGSSTGTGVLQRRCACGNRTDGAAECAGCSQKKTGLQAKLDIGRSDDHFEREADRVAEHVTSKPLQAAIGAAAPRVQRFTASAAAGEASASVARALADSGRPLDAPLRSEMEQRFAFDFSGVRVHTGPTAADSARDVNALAYTVGTHVVFGANRFAPGSSEGRRLLAHELTHVVQQSGGSAGIAPAPPSLQRKCRGELGEPSPACTPSTDGAAGTQFHFKAGCDEMYPGEEHHIRKLRYGRKLKIHGFASREGDAGFNDKLSCHRANVIAELARTQRPECPVIGIFQHGASAAPPTRDGNVLDFWRSVIVEEIRPTREEWLDPTSIISKGWDAWRKASNAPTTANLDAAAAHRASVKGWLDDISTKAAPAGKELDRKDITDYKDVYGSAEFLWKSIDKLLADQKHAAAQTDTYVQWAGPIGTADPNDKMHAQHVPKGITYHVDIFGEGQYGQALNVGMAKRTSTTGKSGARVPHSIYRKFTADRKANRLPFEDGVADLVTSENGPLEQPGLIDEIARIVRPGGTIVLFGPDNMEPAHDKVARRVKGKIKKIPDGDGGLESIIDVPKAP